jgi:hypothetical protein
LVLEKYQGGMACGKRQHNNNNNNNNNSNNVKTNVIPVTIGANGTI